MKRSLVLFTILAFAVLAFAQGVSNNAANKVHAVGNTMLVWGPQTDVTLLSTEVKTSDKADLLIEFSALCSISIADYNYINDYLDDYGLYNVGISVWIEVDGNPVPFDPTVGDSGQVTFYQIVARKIMGIDSYSYTFIYSGGMPFPHSHGATTGTTTEYWEDYFKQYAQANSFKWFAYDVGHGTHTIEVKARIWRTQNNVNIANAFVGPRTLVVEPLNNLK